VTKKKVGHDFVRTYLANSVTLGTRVRVEILRYVAKCFASEGKTMHVTAFTSRLLLHVRPKESNSRALAYAFADVMARYRQQIR
jgi:hypothetical protein